MTIGIDARFFGPKAKGLGRYTQKLIENLEKIDTENNYVIFLRRENFNDYVPDNAKFKKVLADYRWYDLAEQIIFPVKIYRQKIDLMHFPHFNAPVFYFKPFAVTIHDLILRRFPTRRASTLGAIKYWVKNAGYKLVIWLAVWRAKKIIAPSEYVKKDIIDAFGVEANKIVVTYEGAGGQESRIKNQESRVNVEGNKVLKPYLLYVGNAYPHKNLENLISAFEILVNDFKKDLQLVFVGGDDYFYRRLKKEANTLIPQSMKVLRKIIFMGFVPDEKLSALYKNAAVYVFPSLCEGFGLPPLEAMSCGVAVASSRAACLPEILGEAAVYFDGRNPRDMAEKISAVLDDDSLRQKLIAAGFERIKLYSWEKMARETQAVYSV